MLEKLSPSQHFEEARQALINLPIGIRSEQNGPKTIYTVFMEAVRLGQRVINLPLYERFSFVVGFTTKFMDELDEEQRKHLDMLPQDQAALLRRQVKSHARHDNVVGELRAHLMAAGLSQAALKLSVIAEAGGRAVASSMFAQRKSSPYPESHKSPQATNDLEKLEAFARMLRELTTSLEPGEKGILDDLGLQEINNYAVSLH